MYALQHKVIHRVSPRPLLLLTSLLLFLTSSLALAQRPGSDGLGNRLYPKMGNGRYDVQHYSIDLSFSPAAYRLTATTVITAVATQDLSRFNLDLHGLTVESVTISGAQAAFERVDHELIVTPEAAVSEGEEFAVVVDYAGRPVPVDDPGVYWPQLGWLFYPNDYSASSAEPSGSMNWFPSNNHPRDKATYTISITVPVGLQAAANGVLTEQVNNKDDTTTFIWQMDEPMATYSVSVVVGDFLVARDDSGALANQSLSLFRPGYILQDYSLHSLAHHRFGNSLSMNSWEDIWLQEGIVSYLEFIYPDDVWHQSSKREIVVYAGYALTPPARPAIDQLYRLGVYWRGAMAIAALGAEVGQDTLFAILRQYIEQYAGGNASTADFIAVAEAVSGRDLGAFFDACLYADEMPPLPE